MSNKKAEDKQKEEDVVTVQASKNAKVDEEQKVSGTTAATDPVETSIADPADPNGYNSAPKNAEGFIKNPVAGGAVPSGTVIFVVNGITQLEGEDLPTSNVDPDGIIEKFGKERSKRRRK